MRRRNMFYLTGQPGWARLGYSPGWGRGRCFFNTANTINPDTGNAQLREALTQQMKNLEQNLADIKQQLEQLQGETNQ